MAQILIRDLKPEAVEQLKLMARRRGRSLQVEVKELLEEVAERNGRLHEFLKFAAEMRRVSGPQTTDSVEILRRDRER